MGASVGLSNTPINDVDRGPTGPPVRTRPDFDEPADGFHSWGESRHRVPLLLSRVLGGGGPVSADGWPNPAGNHRARTPAHIRYAFMEPVTEVLLLTTPTRKSSPPRAIEGTCRPTGAQVLAPRKTDPVGITQLQVSGRIRRVGNGLALWIPARDARKAGLAAGDPVDAVIRRGVLDAFGLLSDLPYRPFERRKEGQWRERL